MKKEELEKLKQLVSGKTFHASREKGSYHDGLIVDFEKKHIVLHPYNYNPYHPQKFFDEVRLEFFENCCTHGQPLALSMLKKKYPRLKECEK